MALVECVPNISEGRDSATIDALRQVLRAQEGVRLLDVDPGADTHRTVFTFVGAPDAVVDAAFAFYAATLDRVDMRGHKGAHPRQGAVDVCPFVPVDGVSMDDCVELARRLGRRVGLELGMPVYLYEAAASSAERSNLAVLRAGEYEGLAKKLGTLKPDFGPSAWSDQVAKSGATAIGARGFLAAYNINLNTRSKRLAHNLALDLREKGRWKRNAAGKIERDAQGNRLRHPGNLRGVKAVGWYIDEYQRAQVSMNLTDLDSTPLHMAFEAAVDQAAKYGLRVTGSELVGLIPKRSLVEAGRFYLQRQKRSVGVPESDLVQTAIQSLGLDELGPFNAKEKVVEYAVASPAPLASLSVQGFIDETLRDSPAPGGGSVAALAAALAAGLSGMVANLTANSKKHKAIRQQMSDLADEAATLAASCTQSIDADTAAFESVLAARRLPKDDPGRDQAILAAMQSAVESPIAVIQAAASTAALAAKAAEHGLEAARSDAAVSARMALAAAEAAYDNVLINLTDIPDEALRSNLHKRAQTALSQAETTARPVFERVRSELEPAAEVNA